MILICYHDPKPLHVVAEHSMIPSIILGQIIVLLSCKTSSGWSTSAFKGVMPAMNGLSNKKERKERSNRHALL
jgi:hypothetical protein